MSNLAIRVEALSKRYRMGVRRAQYRTLRETLTDSFVAPFRRMRTSKDVHEEASAHSFWALKDVTFDVAQGEVIGIIGRNGAGKSTLLKILSRITDPTEGFADMFGRVGSLLEVGTGFHGELTGRENIQLSGAILGMRRAEITRKFDEIVDFAGVDQFVDTAVKHYSSGMYLRLAFAVAAHLDPEILMVDEVLAVGDAEFQRKCLGKMQEVGASGRTVLVVSHDLSAILQLASRAILLEKGRVSFEGPSGEAVARYSAEQPRVANLESRRDRGGDGAMRIDELTILDDRARTTSAIGSGRPATMTLRCHSRMGAFTSRDVTAQIRLTDILGHPITTFSTRFGSPTPPCSGLTEVVFVCQIPSLDLAEDTYAIDVWVEFRGVLADFVVRASEIHVTPTDYFGTGSAPIKRWHGAAIVKHQWSLGDSQRPADALDAAGESGEASSQIPVVAP